jgi:hypothetical protein
MEKQNWLSGAFCAAAFTLMISVVSSSTSLRAQAIGDSSCGMFDGKLCRESTTTTCTGNTCVTETSYYYYAKVE